MSIVDSGGSASSLRGPRAPAAGVQTRARRLGGVLRSLLWRVFGLIVTLLVASFLIFSATYLVPGSVVTTITG